MNVILNVVDITLPTSQRQAAGKFCSEQLNARPAVCVTQLCAGICGHVYTVCYTEILNGSYNALCTHTIARAHTQTRVLL